MGKVGTSVRIEEDLLKRLDQIAEKRYGSNRNAAIEVAIEQFVESTPRCPLCGEVAREGELLCPRCAVPMTDEMREEIRRLRELIADHPEVIMAAIQEYMQERDEEGSPGK